MSPAATTELTAISRSPSLPTFFDNLDSFAEAPEGVAKLRALVLDLAVRGKLVEQDENDEPASELLEYIKSEVAALVEANDIPKPKRLLPFEANGQQVPSGWVPIRSGELFTFVTSGSRGWAKYYSDDGPIFLRIGNLDYATTKLDLTNIQRVSPPNTTETRRTSVQPNDILVSVTGDTGMVGLIPPDFEQAHINQHIALIRPSRHIDARYVAMFFTSPWALSHLHGAQRGIKNSLGLEDVRTVPMLLPPLSEQRRIVSKVDGLMSLCDELESRGSERVRLRERASRSCLARLVSAGVQPSGDRQVAKACTPTGDRASAWQRLSDHFEVLYDTPETLAHLRQSILQLAVQGKLVPQDPNDEPIEKAITTARKRAGLSTLRFDRERKGNAEFDLPASWRWVSVHDVAEHRLGKMLDKVKNTGRPQPYLRNTNVHWFRFDLTSIKEMLFEDDDLDEFEVRQGDLMICEGGHGIARTAVWEEQLDRVMFQKALHRVRPLNCLDSYFLAFCLRVYEATGVLQRYYTGAGIPHFTGKSLGKVLFPLPPLAEQVRIVAKVDQLLSQCDELSARLRDRQSATQQLLTATIYQILNATEESTCGTT